MIRPPLRLVSVLCLCGTFAAACAGPTNEHPTQKTFDAGRAAYDRGDYAKAYALWSSIDTEDLAAMRNEAILLRKGLGVKKDPARAEALLERAGAAGLVTAEADLGDMLLRGEAGPPNPQAALPWLERAALAGHPLAQYELGELFETGTAVDRNPTVARHLYQEAAAGGVKEAVARLAALPPPKPGEAGAAGPPGTQTP